MPCVSWPKLTHYPSGGINSPQLPCDYGAVYASFSPDVATFIKRGGEPVSQPAVAAAHWVDASVASTAVRPLRASA
jgi:hypothetical protein